MTDPENIKRKNIFLYLRILVVAAGVTAGIFWLSFNNRWQRKNLKDIIVNVEKMLFS
jgi:hypothetical protein